MLLGKFGTVLPIIGMKDPLHYRNKVHAVFAFEKGKAIAGTYQEGTHKVVPVESCLIDDEKSDAIIRQSANYGDLSRLKLTNEDSGYGLLRHVLIRRGFTSVRSWLCWLHPLLFSLLRIILSKPSEKNIRRLQL